MSAESAADSPTAPSDQRPLTRALRDAVSDVKGIASFLLAITGFLAAYFKLRDAIPLEEPWRMILCLVPFAILFLLYIWPCWREAAAHQRLHDLGINGRLKEPGYFRLTPYEAQDRD